MLEALMENDFEWPAVVEETEESSIEGNGGIVIPEDESPLGSAGYHVGYSGLGEDDRRNILSWLFESVLVFHQDYSDERKIKWGLPNSSKRLKKMAEHLVYDISFHGKRLGHNSLAVREWKSDLKWLKNTYYKKTKSRFSWPGV